MQTFIVELSFYVHQRMKSSSDTGQNNSAVALIRTFSYDFTVDAAQIHIRRLAPSESAAYREIRLEALRCRPEAFGSTFDVESARPFEQFTERVMNCPVFGAFRKGELVGVAGFKGREGAKDAHKGMLWACTFELARGARASAGVWRRR